jgi:glucosyl-dolichyl phosphate glucuronosyltransferase
MEHMTSASCAPPLDAPAFGPVSAGDVSVVICAYTEARWDDLCAAVASVHAQTAEPLEVVVVVDHNEALLARARAALDDRVIANHQARGLSGARNSGVAAARGSVIAFLDDDAVAYEDWLEHLTAAYADGPIIGVGGPADAVWDAGRPVQFPPEFDWVVGCTYRGTPEARAPIRNPVGANMSLRRSVFEEIGGFRSGIGRVGAVPVGCEETELCIRAGRRWPEGRILYEPRARVGHRVPAERAGWRYFRSRCFAEGRSKALVATLAGAGAGLASERSYAARTLPAGVARGVADAVRGDVAGIGRALLIMAGLALTTMGYVTGMLLRRPLVEEIA